MERQVGKNEVKPDIIKIRGKIVINFIGKYNKMALKSRGVRADWTIAITVQ